MRHKLVHETAGERTFVVVFDAGDETMETLEAFAAAQNISAASLTALGAFSTAEVGFFNVDRKGYEKIPVDMQTEVLSLVGNIARGEDGDPALHVHAVLGLRDGSTRGGHLMRGLVMPTLEMTVVESPAYLQRRQRPEFGLALIDLS